MKHIRTRTVPKRDNEKELSLHQKGPIIDQKQNNTNTHSLLLIKILSEAFGRQPLLILLTLYSG